MNLKFLGKKLFESLASGLKYRSINYYTEMVSKCLCKQ